MGSDGCDGSRRPRTRSRRLGLIKRAGLSQDNLSVPIALKCTVEKFSRNLLVSVILVVLGASLTYLFNAWGTLALATIWSAIAITVAVVFRGKISERLRRGSTISGQEQEEDSSGPATEVLPPSEICDPGPYTLEGGEYKVIPLDVSPGDHIIGRMGEEEGDDFDWYIVDEKNLVAFQNDETFEVIAGECHIQASIVDVHVDSVGPWFLLLSNAGRQIERIIEVHLRRE